VAFSVKDAKLKAQTIWLGTTEATCEIAGWNNYTVPFASLGYVQIRMTSTL
jgi:hypothetical protein